MGYKLENKPIDISEKKRLTQISTNKNGTLYRYRNVALKVFRDGETPPMDQETARYLSTVSTDKILLPKRLLFYNNAFKGYTMKLVSQKGANKKMMTTPTEELLSGIEILEGDIKKISYKKILLNGIHPENTIYNGDFYLTDPTQYTILETNSLKKLEEINKFQFHLLLTELISSEMHKYHFTQATINRMKELMNLRDNDQDSSNYLRKMMNGQEDMRQFVKKI